MCKLSALSTPTMAKTMSTPANNQRKERLVRAERISNKVLCSTLKTETVSRLMRLAGKWGMRLFVPSAVIKIDAIISNDRVKPKGA